MSDETPDFKLLKFEPPKPDIESPAILGGAVAAVLPFPPRFGIYLLSNGADVLVTRDLFNLIVFTLREGTPVDRLNLSQRLIDAL